MKHTMTNVALVLTAMGGLTGCVGIKQGGGSLNSVDELLSAVERVHVESVLCRERMSDALATLHDIVSPDFRGDALACYARFVDAVEQAEAQAKDLHASVAPMKSTAESVFNKWATDLVGFADPDLREHSQARLKQTRNRYQAILSAVEPAQQAFDAFNGSLRDHALFLSHDFNAAAVAAIERTVGDLVVRAEKLDGQFVATERAAQAYVRSTALRGQVSLSRNVNREPAAGDRQETLLRRD